MQTGKPSFNSNFNPAPRFGFAYKVTDDDIARAQAKYGDDQMFEIVVSAALGASAKRLRLGLAALDKA